MTFLTFFFFLPIPSFLSVEYLLLSSIPHRRRKRLSFSRQHAPLETSATVVCRAFGPEENKLGPQCRVTVPARAPGLTHSQTSVLPPSRGSRRLLVPSRWCATSSKSGARAPKGRQMRSIAALALRPQRPLQSPPGWFSPHAWRSEGFSRTECWRHVWRRGERESLLSALELEGRGTQVRAR